MSNVSNRFTFRDGRTCLTGYPKWPGIHDLNDPVYSGYDTLYIGPETPDQNQYFIIGPSCATTYTPTISLYSEVDGMFLTPEILSPGLHVYYHIAGDFIETTPADTPNILSTLEQHRQELYADQDAITPKIIPVMIGQSISFLFQDNHYQPGKEFMPNFDITTNNPWTPMLILPVGPFTSTKGYSIKGEKLNTTAFVYFDGEEQGDEFTKSAMVPILFDYGPRWHYQNALAPGQHWYDTCYHFRFVNLKSTPA